MSPDNISWIDAFKESPLPMLLAVLLGMMALVITIVGLVVRSRGAIALSAVGLLLAFGVIAAGAGGMLLGRSHTDAAVSSPGLSPIDRARITEYGYAESAVPLKFSLIVAATPLAIGVVALLRALTRRREQSA